MFSIFSNNPIFSKNSVSLIPRYLQLLQGVKPNEANILLSSNNTLRNEINELSNEDFIRLFAEVFERSHNGNDYYVSSLLNVIIAKDKLHNYVLLNRISNKFNFDNKKCRNLKKLIQKYLDSDNKQMAIPLPVENVFKVLSHPRMSYDSILLMLGKNMELRHAICSLSETDATQLIIKLIKRTPNGNNRLVKQCLLLINNVHVIDNLFEYYKKVNIDKRKYTFITKMLDQCVALITPKTLTNINDDTNTLNLTKELNNLLKKFPKPDELNGQAQFVLPLQNENIESLVLALEAISSETSINDFEIILNDNLVNKVLKFKIDSFSQYSQFWNNWSSQTSFDPSITRKRQAEEIEDIVQHKKSRYDDSDLSELYTNTTVADQLVDEQASSQYPPQIFNILSNLQPVALATSSYGLFSSDAEINPTTEELDNISNIQLN